VDRSRWRALLPCRLSHNRGSDPCSDCSGRDDITWNYADLDQIGALRMRAVWNKTLIRVFR